MFIETSQKNLLEKPLSPLIRQSISITWWGCERCGSNNLFISWCSKWVFIQLCENPLFTSSSKVIFLKIQRQTLQISWLYCLWYGSDETRMIHTSSAPLHFNTAFYCRSDWIFSSQLKLRDNIFSSSVSEEEEIDEDKNLKVGELSHVPEVFLFC